MHMQAPSASLHKLSSTEPLSAFRGTLIIAAVRGSVAMFIRPKYIQSVKASGSSENVVLNCYRPLIYVRAPEYAALIT